MFYKDLLASVTTNMDGVANRSFNVARAAEFCNGKVIQPGEVFSYLDTIGDPSARNGYKASSALTDRPITAGVSLPSPSTPGALGSTWTSPRSTCPLSSAPGSVSALMDCSPEAAVDVGFAAKENTPFWKLGALWLGLADEPNTEENHAPR